MAIVVHTGSRLNILLIQRAEHPNDPWSGHMGLPGGRWEPEDQTLLQTARRETKEEVGLDLARDGELVGLLPTIPAVARGQATDLTISPFVFLYDGISTLTTNDEVQAALWVPLETLDRKALTVAVHRDGHIVSLPGWNVEGRTVWGLTHGILRHLLAELDRR